MQPFGTVNHLRLALLDLFSCLTETVVEPVGAPIEESFGPPTSLDVTDTFASPTAFALNVN